MKTVVHIDQYTDDRAPAGNLADWAQWLFGNAEDDGPGRVVADGETFEVTVSDVTYTACPFEEGKVRFPTPIDWTAEAVAVAFGEGLGWCEDDFVNNEAEAQAYAIDGNAEEGEVLWIAQMTSRDGDRTVTYRIIDGEPFLQPDGWSL